ncbi:MAG: DciA family protein [Pirellulaceae bacterium]
MSHPDDQESIQRAEASFQERRVYERMPHSAGDLISKLISRRGFTQTQFHDELQTAWQEVAGPQMAGRTQATVIRRGALEVIVDSSPAMQQLAFAKSKLLRQIQDQLPHAGICSIRFRVGNIRN